MLYDQIAERHAIGSLLNCSSTKQAETWITRLTAECFHNPQLQTVFTAMCEVMARDEPQRPDLINVNMQLENYHPDCNMPASELALCAAEAMSVSDPSLVIEVLQDLRVRRAVLTIAQRLGYLAEQRSISMATEVEKVITELTMLDITQTHHGTPLHDVLDELTTRVNENRQSSDRHHGPWTGVEPLDRDGGLPETGLVVLAGGTSQGKSALGAVITLRSADHGMASAYFSLELSNLSLASRMVSMDNRGLSAQGIKSWRLNDEDWRRTLQEIASTDAKYGRMIYFDDCRSTSLDDICTGIRFMHHKHGIRLAVVDFLQLLNYTMDARQSNSTIEQQMGYAARKLKNLGDRLGICVVVLCQINRSQDRMRPTLGIIRDSGQIAEAADMAIFTWRPDAYHGAYDLDLADYRTRDTLAFLVLKNREGALMERLLHWDGLHTLAEDIPDHELYMYKTSYEATPTTQIIEAGLFD